VKEKTESVSSVQHYKVLHAFKKPLQQYRGVMVMVCFTLI